MELDKLESEYKKLSEKLRSYEQSMSDVQRLFSDLGLNYSGDMSVDYNSFWNIRNNLPERVQNLKVI